MRKLRKLLLPKGFYTSMFLLSVIILGVFSLFSALIAGSMAQRYEKAQYFKNYDYALRSISDTFAQKLLIFPTESPLKSQAAPPDAMNLSAAFWRPVIMKR